jgi:hypothetical protein
MRVCIVLMLLCVAAGPATMPSVEQRIEKLRPRADMIRIDGKADDWAGVPSYADPAGDAGKKPALDLVRTAIAPRADDLLIMIETAGRPIALASSYAFDIDLVGSPEPELQISIGKPGETTALIYERGKDAQPKPIKGVQAAIAQVVEVRIPYASLIDVLPPAVGQELKKNPRAWVRVMPVTVDAFAKSFADFGAAAASYRLVKDLHIDPPLPGSDETPLKMPLPVAGRWMMHQGPFGQVTHQDIWAYDLVKVDGAFRPSKVLNSTKNEDYFGWDQTVTATLGGRVIRAHAEATDHTPPKQADKDAPVNEVYLQVARDTALNLAHFHQNTVTAKEGDTIALGSPLGGVGNSGYSSIPHLHLAAWRLPSGEKTVPIIFANVRVGLNAVDDDYWARDLDEWSPREGMVVQGMQ